MVKISNLFVAAGLFVGAVLVIYGTKPILKTSAEPKVEMVLKRVQLRGDVVDLTRVASRTRTVSAPLKSGRCCGVARWPSPETGSFHHF